MRTVKPKPVPVLPVNPDSPRRFNSLSNRDQQRLMRWLSANVIPDNSSVVDSWEVWRAYRADTGHDVPHGAIVGAMWGTYKRVAVYGSMERIRRYAARLT